MNCGIFKLYFPISVKLDTTTGRLFICNRSTLYVAARRNSFYLLYGRNRILLLYGKPLYIIPSLPTTLNRFGLIKISYRTSTKSWIGQPTDDARHCCHRNNHYNNFTHNALVSVQDEHVYICVCVWCVSVP